MRTKILQNRNSSIIGIALVIALLSFPQGAGLTQLFYKKISIERIIDRSDYILIVKKIKPFISREKQSILPEGSKYKNKNNPPYYEPPYFDKVNMPSKDKNYPPYMRKIFHFQIEGILFSANTKLKPGMKINVSEANSHFNFEMHKNYYLKGIRKSPMIGSYKSSLNHEDYEKSEKLIVFISSDPFQYVVNSSYESINTENKIVNLIKKIKNKKP